MRAIYISYTFAYNASLSLTLKRTQLKHTLTVRAENSSEVVVPAPAVNRRWKSESDAAGLTNQEKRILRRAGLILIGGLIKVVTVNSPPGAAGH